MSKDVCWIEIIAEDAATGELKAAYDALIEKDGYVENLYRAFSRYPQAILSADQAYRDVLHVAEAPLPMWLSELIVAQAAVIAKCHYALANHGDNMVRLHDDEAQGREMLAALVAGDWENSAFDEPTRALLAFCEKLAVRPDQMARDDVGRLRGAGFDDEDVSQIVQVAANSAYWMRAINGLGIRLGREPVGKYS